MGVKKLAYINGNMLKWARERTPLSDEMICQKLKGITMDIFNDWENGTQLPTISQAKEMAQLFDVPFAAFYLPEPPVENRPNYIDKRTYKDEATTISYELWKEINRLITIRETIINFVSDEMDFPSLIFKGDLNNLYDDIRRIFDIKTPYKNKSQYSNQAFNMYRTIFERHGILVIQIEKISIKQIRGISLSYDVLPIIAVNRGDSDRGKVFTMFHELGHIIRRTSNLCLPDLKNENDDEEKKCNEFAVNVLVPKDEFLKSIQGLNIKDDENIKMLADKYTVSKFVILKRLYDLMIISYNYYQLKYKEYSEVVEEVIKKKKEVRIPSDVMFLSGNGKLYPSIVFKAYYDGNISYGELSNLFGLKSKYLPNIEKAVI